MADRVAVLRGAGRGAVAAMAMSGLRQATRASGLIGSTPPEEIVRRKASGLFHRLPPGRRPALVELAHWSYGTAGGVLFGALPRPVRRNPWTGPVYGVLFWTVFELGVAPALGLTDRRHEVAGRVALLADHLLYGAVVAATPWLHKD